MTNNYGYTGALFQLPRLRKRPSQGFIQGNYKKLMDYDNLDAGKWKPAIYLQEQEMVGSVLELMTGEKNLRWWKYEW